MVEISRDFDDFETEPLPEIEHKNPATEARRNYLEGDQLLHDGHILDGLLKLHLARDFIDGWSAPRHAKPKRPLDGTVAGLDEKIDRAKQELREHGPLRIRQAETGSGADVNGRNRLH